MGNPCCVDQFQFLFKHCLSLKSSIIVCIIDHIVVNEAKSRPWYKVIHLGKADCSITIQELGRVSWEQLLLGKSTSDMWESNECQHAPVRKKDKKEKEWGTLDLRSSGT